MIALMPGIETPPVDGADRLFRYCYRHPDPGIIKPSHFAFSNQQFDYFFLY